MSTHLNQQLLVLFISIATAAYSAHQSTLLIPIGLGQCGNNCFQNAVLQMLWQIDDLRALLLTMDEQLFPATSITSLTIRLFKEMDRKAHYNLVTFHGNQTHLYYDANIFKQHTFVPCDADKELDLFTKKGWDIIGKERYTQSDAVNFLNKFLTVFFAETKQFAPAQFQKIITTCAYIKEIREEGVGLPVSRVVQINAPQLLNSIIDEAYRFQFNSSKIPFVRTTVSSRHHAIAVTNKTESDLVLKYIQKAVGAGKVMRTIRIAPDVTYFIPTDDIETNGEFIRFIWHTNDRLIDGRMCEKQVEKMSVHSLTFYSQELYQWDTENKVPGERRKVVDSIEEIMAGQFAYKIVDGMRRTFFVTLPTWLTFSLPRGFADRGKIQNAFIVPLTLDMSPYLADAEQKQDPKYGLFVLRAAVQHLGANNESGHWIAYVNTSSGWYTCNDTHIEPIRGNFFETIVPSLSEGSLFLYESAAHEKQRLDPINEALFRQFSARKQPAVETLGTALDAFTNALSTLLQTIT